MSTGSLFHTEWYTDPPWDNVSLSWLSNYVNNIRSNPMLSKAIAAENEVFEMVPMPKEFLNQLAATRPKKMSTSTASVRQSQQVNGILRNFSHALESGNLEAAAALLSANYHDASGRNITQVKEDLQKFLANASGLKIVPLSTTDVLSLGDRLLSANIQIAWEANLKGASREAAHNATSSQINLVLEKNTAGEWSIAGLRVS